MHATPVFKPRRLGHVNIFVGDVQQACRFYASVCGVEQVYFETDIQMGFMTNGRSNHDLGLMQAMNKPRIGRDGYVQPSTGRGAAPSLNHLGFELESQRELVNAYKRAVAAGVKVSATSDHCVARSIYLHDPDGNMVEFYADAVEDWRGFYRKGKSALITGAWDPLAGTPDDRPLYEKQFTPAVVPGATFHPSGIHSAGLLVGDLGRSARFYEEVGGLRRGADSANSIVMLGSTGQPAVTLVAGQRPGRPPGLHHMSFEVPGTAALSDARRVLAAGGVAPAGELSHPGGESLFIRDADGFLIEMFAGSHGYAAAGLLGSASLPSGLQ